MKKQKSCGICAYTKVLLENNIMEEQANKEKYEDLKLPHLREKSHYKMRAFQELLNKMILLEKRSSNKIA